MKRSTFEYDRIIWFKQQQNLAANILKHLNAFHCFKPLLAEGRAFVTILHNETFKKTHRKMASKGILGRPLLCDCCIKCAAKYRIS